MEPDSLPEGFRVCGMDSVSLPRGWGRYIRTSQIAQELGLSHATVRQMARDGRLPRPFRCGRRLLLWRAAEVAAAVAAFREEGA